MKTIKQHQETVKKKEDLLCLNLSLNSASFLSLFSFRIWNNGKTSTVRDGHDFMQVSPK